MRQHKNNSFRAFINKITFCYLKYLQRPNPTHPFQTARLFFLQKYCETSIDYIKEKDMTLIMKNIKSTEQRVLYNEMKNFKFMIVTNYKSDVKILAIRCDQILSEFDKCHQCCLSSRYISFRFLRKLSYLYFASVKLD